MEHLLWTEKYRPQTVAECILPERMKDSFQEYVNKKQIPNLMLTGGPGIGKTTAAKAMCIEVGCDYMVLNGSDERGIDTIRFKVKNYASSMSFSGGRKVIILDEADYLTPEAQAILRGAIEEFEINCSFIFTCNYKSKLIEALHSRCSVIDFSLKNNEKKEMASQFFKRVCDILKTENVEYNEKVLVEVIKKHFPDFRRVLNELQRYSQSGKIDVGILSQLTDASLSEVIKFMKAKDFISVRKWVATSEVSSVSLYRDLYDNLYDYVLPESIPGIVLILADYQFKQAFVADHEINMVACLTEIMAGADFK
jgi:DNA polymerase III delta prime subunit